MKNKKNRKDKRIKFSLFSIWNFLFYFILAAFMVTCSFMLFFQRGDAETDIIILNETLSTRAFYTLGNILFLCVMFSIFDSIKKRITVGRPVERILDATHRITKGDFSVRIKPLNPIARRNEFDVIIEDFNKMAEELSTTETLKTDFIANVSHEIKTPLAVIQNYATLLQDPTLSEEQRLKYTENISDASKRLSGLITNILRLNKLENQQIFPSNKPYNLSEQLCECILIFEDKLEKKALNLEIDLDETIIINADSELLDHVWINILSNAIKFTDNGGTVSVTLKREKGKAVVRISDTGCGMNEDIGIHIFEKFYQGDTSHSTRGNGLGLALVKRVIDITSSEIQVESELNKGTTFTVLLPIN
ncbi:MAG: HAMP domain-containing histidine kinase [Clostridia bacterium]|nr:HAMP domain-containing histidine kinase [Clostridia bacterium]